MPILSVGRASKRRAGVTLVEMLIVVTLLSLMVGITFPSISSGVETLRLNSAAEDVVGFFNFAINRAERRQHAIEVTISREANALIARSPEPGFERVVRFPDRVTILAIVPPLPMEDPRGRRILIMPGAPPPRTGVVLANAKGDRRLIRLDPVSGLPQVVKLGPRETE